MTGDEQRCDMGNAMLILGAILLAALLAVGSCTENADPSPTGAPTPTRATPTATRDAEPRALPASRSSRSGNTRVAIPTSVSAWVERVRRCIVHRESRGDYRAQNPRSTASGAFQFLDSTWQAVTGLPGSARDYPPSVQDAAFYELFDDGRGRHHWHLAGAAQQCW